MKTKDVAVLPPDYVICMYVRLSSEDEDVSENAFKDESCSITAQRQLIRDYIGSHVEFSRCRVIERCDDGFSGTHFDTRPGFTEMIGLAKKGGVNCIIVKDFSRFGRNYVELGDYLEQLFPFLGVRFISVNDGYDSEDLKDGETGGLDVAFKNIIYDYYSRELSKKVRLAKRQLAQRGQYSATHALFGYRKSDEDKHKLVLEAGEAQVVREIFDMKLAGTRITDIARNLNNRGIACPVVRYMEQGRVASWGKRKDGFTWTPGYILNVLQNEEYTGTLVAQKHRSPEVGACRSVPVPEEEWVKVEGTHEAIVSKKEFAALQKMLGTQQRKERVKRNIYKCGYCGRRMMDRAKTGSMYCMTGRIAPREDCKRAKVRNDEADAAVLQAVKQKLQASLDEEELHRTEIHEGKKNLSDQVAAVVSSMKAGKKAWMKMYDDYSDEKIGREAFLEFKKQHEEEMKELEDKLAKLRSRQEARAANREPPSMEKYREILEAAELTQEIMNAFVEDVEVFGNGRLGIHLKAVAEFE